MNIYRVYLHVMLAIGVTIHVRYMINYWRDASPKKRGAALEASNSLIANYDYPACTSCGWVTKIEGEHFVPGSWCDDEDFFQRWGCYPIDEISGVPAHQLFPQRLRTVR
jgi:hypothetical protein